MNESRKEFLGITVPSLLAVFGLLITLLPVGFKFGPLLRNIIGAIALGMIIAGIIINRRKGLKGRWRRTNYGLHIAMLVLAIVVIVFYNYRWGF